MDIPIKPPSGSKVSAFPPIDIEVLALDLDRCAPCAGTLVRVETAVRILHPVLEVLGVPLRLEKRIIGSEKQAVRHRFAASPTVRVNGQDIAFETRERECESCTCLCNGAHRTRCRVWRYRGEEHREAPVGLIVESVLGVLLGRFPAASGEAMPYRLPDNLRNFFRHRSGRTPSCPDCASPGHPSSVGTGSQVGCCGRVEGR